MTHVDGPEGLVEVARVHYSLTAGTWAANLRVGRSSPISAESHVNDDSLIPEEVLDGAVIVVEEGPRLSPSIRVWRLRSDVGRDIVSRKEVDRDAVLVPKRSPHTAAGTVEACAVRARAGILDTATDVRIIKGVTALLKHFAGTELLLADLAARSRVQRHLVALLCVGSLYNIDLSVPRPRRERPVSSKQKEAARPDLPVSADSPEC